MGITEAGCEGGKKTIAFLSSRLQERGPGLFSQNRVWQRAERRWGDSLFPVKPASSQERHRTRMIK